MKEIKNKCCCFFLLFKHFVKGSHSGLKMHTTLSDPKKYCFGSELPYSNFQMSSFMGAKMSY